MARRQLGLLTTGSGRPIRPVLAAVLKGAAAGAAGTTALDAATYADMALRGLPASSTPERGIERLAGAVGARIPGRGDTRAHRVTGLGALTGLGAGVLTGAALGGLRGLGWRPGPVGSAVLATGLALLAGNAPMTMLGVTDPRDWSPGDWAADLGPHVAYGVVTGAVLAALDPG